MQDTVALYVPLLVCITAWCLSRRGMHHCMTVQSQGMHRLHGFNFQNCPQPLGYSDGEGHTAGVDLGSPELT